MLAERSERSERPPERPSPSAAPAASPSRASPSYDSSRARASSTTSLSLWFTPAAVSSVAGARPRMPGSATANAR